MFSLLIKCHELVVTSDFDPILYTADYSDKQDRPWNRVWKDLHLQDQEREDLHLRDRVWKDLQELTWDGQVLHFKMPVADDLERTLGALDMKEPADMAQVKSIRRQRKAAVTRTLGSLAKYQSDRDIESVKDRLDIVKQQFDNLEYAHDFYNDHLESEAEIVKSESWFLDCQADYATIEDNKLRC